MSVNATSRGDRIQYADRWGNNRISRTVLNRIMILETEALTRRFGGLTAVDALTVALVLGAALFATFSLIIACLVKTRERFMGIGQLLTMPLFFASNAIYPIGLMPEWLRVVSRINPPSYQVDALRAHTSIHASSSDLSATVRPASS